MLNRSAASESCSAPRSMWNSRWVQFYPITPRHGNIRRDRAMPRTENLTRFYAVEPRSLPCLALPCHALPCRTGSCHTMPCLGPCRASLLAPPCRTGSCYTTTLPCRGPCGPCRDVLYQFLPRKSSSCRVEFHHFVDLPDLCLLVGDYERQSHSKSVTLASKRPNSPPRCGR